MYPSGRQRVKASPGQGSNKRAQKQKMKKHVALAAAAIAMAVGPMAGSARAADLYWSGAGTWDTTNANWGTGPGGPR